MAQDEEIRFALGVIDDNQRLIAAGKNQRWHVVKWAVTINVALAAASIAVKQKDVSLLENIIRRGICRLAKRNNSIDGVRHLPVLCGVPDLGPRR